MQVPSVARSVLASASGCIGFGFLVNKHLNSLISLVITAFSSDDLDIFRQGTAHADLSDIAHAMCFATLPQQVTPPWPRAVLFLR